MHAGKFARLVDIPLSALEALVGEVPSVEAHFRQMAVGHISVKLGRLLNSLAITIINFKAKTAR